MNSEWLTALTEFDVRSGNFPLEEILKDCCFYPASGSDGTPVRAYSKLVESFVYVDWAPWTGRNEYLSLFETEPFTGYKVLASRDVTELELNPRRHAPKVPKSLDIRRYTAPREAIENPFAVWTILEREEGFDDGHGPKRFSLLYIRADGTATYQVLFQGSGLLPKIACSIRPGTGFGGNYGNFDEVFLECIEMHPKGRPAFMSLWDGSMYEGSVWREICDFEHPASETTKDGEHAPVLLLPVRQRP